MYYIWEIKGQSKPGLLHTPLSFDEVKNLILSSNPLACNLEQINAVEFEAASCLDFQYLEKLTTGDDT
jgi:hypothetical protein